MTAAAEKTNKTLAFRADVAKLLHMMVHSVYSDRDVFLRELISNAADACERLRYEALAQPGLLADDPAPRITLAIDADNRKLSVEDNGIGMTHDELVQSLGTIAHSGTRAFMERMAAGPSGEVAGALIGKFGVGLLFGFRGGRSRRRPFPPRRYGRGLAVVVGRQGKLHGVAVRRV